MTDLLVALGLVFVIEGLIWALVPGYARRMLEAISEMSDTSVRNAAVFSVALGVVIVWLVRA